ncbi:hypothetical protein V6N12_042161 [Hibiscus sabdariffa]|uniref:Uncharacterized protein n=1 Tax=Hibiscus sabdariffa TaxID=183260 RepID=A0ABR2EEE1_9ROSI
MDMDCATVVVDDPLMVNGNNVRSQAITDVDFVVATPVVVSLTLPSFRDMVVRQFANSQRVNMFGEFDVELAADDVQISNSGVYPEIRFSDRVHKELNAMLAKYLVRRPSNQAGLAAALNGGSHFGVLGDIVKPQHHVTLPQHADTVNGQRVGDVTRGVMSTTSIESDIVVPGRALSSVNVQAIQEGSRPSDGHVMEKAVDIGLEKESVVVDSVQVPSLAAKGKVVTAPSSLQAGKHTAARVIDESSKRIFQEHNG